MQLKKATVLVIDDDPDVLTAVRLLLRPQVKEIVAEKNPANLPSLLRQYAFDVILLDMNFAASIHTGNEGIFWLKEIKRLKAQAAVIMITAYGDIDLAIRSLKEGAYDFVVKPWHNERLLTTLQEAVSGKQKSPKANGQSSSGSLTAPELLGESEAMQDIFYKIKKVAPTDANILILGENGTGKELIAKAIHQHSLRANQPFVKVDVGALTESLFESELFGHKKGAFTDAREERAGRFEAADKGTIFLDEIGNISLQQQAKLLSVLQNRQVIRVGSNEPINVNVRLLCATNVSLTDLASDARFRKDLIYRINTVEILVPPLRQRGNDVLLLARHYMALYAEKYFKGPLDLTARAIEKLKNYSFPGNVRELQYAMERAVIMADDQALDARDIIFSPIESVQPESILPTATNLEELERATIIKVLEKHNGVMTKAAKELGITRTALYRRLGKYEL
ncbi:sigma-54-dependent transcriptional regulator [Rufibacter glacialis]|uniref:Sigma-54-dependent Fis family transcriptional regulator n=1 Tax=Rufibacter glacialis TaxID=1259555 RepID=A0A5M8QAJ3_9BACT|nr:sigma-54 dependent transcriptional regulator [Rufibacter glacialis]KAA6431836.1 sigma-54-dependent Fis family transcriptional regulator [Rufibacter glacialis]GGK81125.1 sigma-54-dependent Fis family transcriptional regulator [Rufibacter glacialis]